MDAMTNDTLRELMQHTDKVCISMYMPMVRAGKQTEQNSIRFKNMLSRTEDALEKMGIRQNERKEILGPAYSYLNDRIVWHQQEEGLAVFIAPGTFMPFRLPLSFQDDLVVSERFSVKPMLPLFSNDGYFYILSLNLERVRLYRGSHYTVHEVEFDAPPGIEEALGFDDVEPLRQQAARTAMPRQGGDKNAMFQGHGLAYEDTKNRIYRYFRKVDEAVHEVVRGKDIPMVLAGNDYLIPIYREANTYPKVMEKAVRKNPLSMSSNDLHQDVWKIIHPAFETAQKEEFDRYKQLERTNMASDDLPEIVKAAPGNRIATLFIAKNSRAWGLYDNENYTVTVHDQQREGDQDLLEFAAVQTILHDGTVFVLDTSEIPGNNPVSAIFRY